MEDSAQINLTDVLTYIIRLAVNCSQNFHHVDMNRVLVCISSNRGRKKSGSYGKLVPLRFKDGQQIIQYDNKYFSIPRIDFNDAEILYLVYFYMPKFFDLPPEDKIKVLYHELYHISPFFNGDIRRMGKVKAAHGFSKDRFNSIFSEDIQGFHRFIKNHDYYKVLSMNSRSLYRTYKKVLARTMKVPKPVVIEGLTI